jgi:hypothetical protein
MLWSTVVGTVVGSAVLLVQLALVVPQIQACPYMNGQRSLMTNHRSNNDTNPHQAARGATWSPLSGLTSSSSTLAAASKTTRHRRKLPPKKNRRSVMSTRTRSHTTQTTTHRKLFVFDSILSFFAAIFDFILGLFGLSRRPPATVEEAIAAARNDINDLLDGDRAAEMLRLAFHDCTDQVCDGCLDLNNLDNRGLADPVDDLQPIVDEYAAFLTRGDVWVLAAYVAIERQQRQSDIVDDIVPFDLTFVGRPSCADPDNNPPADTLPSAHLNTAGLTAFFANTFAFDDRETAAIMGAHTLYVVSRRMCVHHGYTLIMACRLSLPPPFF